MIQNNNQCFQISDWLISETVKFWTVGDNVSRFPKLHLGLVYSTRTKASTSFLLCLWKHVTNVFKIFIWFICYNYNLYNTNSSIFYYSYSAFSKKILISLITHSHSANVLQSECMVANLLKSVNLITLCVMLTSLVSWYQSENRIHRSTKQFWVTFNTVWPPATCAGS